ncbi:MAG: hypothetical protein ABUL64_00800, partial [Singulisphaera sp.]
MKGSRGQERADLSARPLSDPVSAANPFSTKRTRPGAISYVFPADLNAELLVRRLSEQQWRGQIIGGHGTGKSTLLATLAPAILATGRQPLLVTLHDRERSLAAHAKILAAIGAKTVVIIDGYEQLALWNRWRLRWRCWRRGSGLLVTAHTSVGLPLLVETAVDASTAQLVLESLVAGPSVVDQAEMEQARKRRHGNLR